MEKLAIQDFGHGITRELLDNEQIVVYTVPDMRREAIDKWVEACLDTLNWLPKESTTRSVHHVTTLSAVLSPYARQKIKEVVRASKEWNGYRAVVIERSITSQLLEVTMRQLARVQRKWSIRFFHDRDEAIEWLRQQPDL